MFFFLTTLLVVAMDCAGILDERLCNLNDCLWQGSQVSGFCTGQKSEYDASFLPPPVEHWELPDEYLFTGNVMWRMLIYVITLALSVVFVLLWGLRVRRPK